MMNFATWEGATRCTGSPTPGAKALLAWLIESQTIGHSGGIYNCRNVAGTATTSTHGEGRGIDWMLPVAAKNAGHALVRALGAHGRALGIQTIIYDRTIYSAKSPEGRPYTGVNPHYDHLHIELTRAAGARLTLATVRAVMATPVVIVPRPGKPAAKQGRAVFNCAIRKGPSLKADKVHVVARRERVTILGSERTGLWWIVLHDTSRGFVMKPAVKVIA